MSIQTFSIGGNRKMLLGVTEGGSNGAKVLYGGYGVRFKTHLWSEQSILDLPKGSDVKVIDGGEGGPVGPPPPQYAPFKTIFHVPGQWHLMLTAKHSNDGSIVLAIYAWSRTHPTKWNGQTFRAGYSKISDTASLSCYDVADGGNARVKVRYFYDNSPWQTNIVGEWDEPYGWTYIKDVYPNYSLTNDNPTDQFPGDDNENDPEGGDGDGPDGIEDDPIEFPEKPGITVTDAGLMTLYTPTQGQIHAFGDFLWSDAFSLDTFKKLFADPMQAVIGLSIVPVAVPTAGAQPITIGAISSGVTANRAASQYVVHDCGTLKVNPVWNTALDFSPYTKFSIYLPFIGTRELKTDDIMGKTLNVKYFVDVLSGACTAHISVDGSVLYQFSGSCATPVPLSAMNWNSTLTSMIQLAGAGIAMAVTGGAAAPAAAGMLTTATGMIGNKPNVQRSGAVSGAAGMLGVKVPYLIRETPRQSLAKDYAHYSGYPSNITAVLGTLKGFTMVENMHLKNIDATADELDEIETALKEGVIL